MNGVSTVSGAQSADPSEPGDSRAGLRETFRLLRTAQAAVEARGEWRLGREIGDALARWESEENPPAQFCIICEGVCRGAEAHGQVTGDAETLGEHHRNRVAAGLQPD